MPIALDPSETVPVVLTTDADKPEPRPTFHARYLTTRDKIKVADLIKRASEDDADGGELLNQALAVQFSGWSNLKTPKGKAIPFGDDKFDDVLTPLEKWELTGSAAAAIRLSELDKKKYPVPAQLDMAPSATPAKTDASTCPTNKTSCNSPACDAGDGTGTKNASCAGASGTRSSRAARSSS